MLLRNGGVPMHLKHRITTAVATIGAVLISGSAAFAAGSGYSPTPSPVPPGTPGGYSHVVTVESVSPNQKSKTVVVVHVNHTKIDMVVSPHTFPIKVQIVVTSPKLGQVTHNLRKYHEGGYQAVAGIGVGVVTGSGHIYKGKFLKPVFVTAINSKIGPGDKVVEWNQRGTFSVLGKPLFRRGKAIWKFQSDPAFAVLAPKKDKGKVVPGATSPVTGEPFASEAIAGIVLIAGGSALLYQTRKRRLS